MVHFHGSTLIPLMVLDNRSQLIPQGFLAQCRVYGQDPSEAKLLPLNLDLQYKLKGPSELIWFHLVEFQSFHRSMHVNRDLQSLPLRKLAEEIHFQCENLKFLRQFFSCHTPFEIHF